MVPDPGLVEAVKLKYISTKVFGTSSEPISPQAVPILYISTRIQVLLVYLLVNSILKIISKTNF